MSARRPARRSPRIRRVPPAVGLTGGIASGKSEIAAVFSRLGARVVSADREAKELLKTDPAVGAKIRKLLGPGAYTPSGRPDRKYIAGRIFSNSSERLKVNAIIHPAVTRRIRRIIAEEKRARRVPLVAVEAALIYEAGIEGLFDAVVVVDAPLRNRMERMRKRNRFSAAEARRRLHSQRGNASNAASADIVITNVGSLSSLRAAGRFVFRLLAGPDVSAG